jgi:serine/threonine protein kinase
VGRGGYAEVWEGEVAQGQRVAIKFMPCGDGKSTPREISALLAVRQLTHKHLIRVHRVFTFLDYLAIVMELAEGGLDDLMQAYEQEFGTPIPTQQVCTYLSQAAEVLDFLNTRQHTIDGKIVSVQHCDVKPSNFLLFGDTVKLSDFGLATVSTGTQKLHRRAGTTIYAAPEVFLGRISDRSDQYSLAVTYYELSTATLPFHDTPPKFEKDYVRPEPDLSLASKAEQSVLARALAPMPQNRWTSCRELIDRLRQAANG